MTLLVADFERLEATALDGLLLLKEEAHDRAQVQQGGYVPGRFERKGSLFDMAT